MDTATASALELRDAIRRGDLTAERATADALARIDAANARLNAFITVGAERALARARALDREPRRTGALHGVPIAVKDTICVRGMRATAGSRLLEDFHAPYDATVVARLEAAGAVVLGKANCDEFAMGSSTEHSAFGAARNPWDPDRTPGGSSGGSAAAVAAGLTPVALGSDTGGSVRQPAAFCGVVGARPTWGRVSRHGLMAFASSLDQVGPLARTVADAALVTDAIAGADPHDATARDPGAPACSSALDAGVRGLRIGVPRDAFDAGVDGGIASRVQAALNRLARAGARIDTVELPSSRYAIPAYYLIATAEASSNLARYDGVRYGRREPDPASLEEMYRRTRGAGFGPEVKRRIMLGTYALSAGYYDAYYARAQQARALVRLDFERALEGRDALALPTSPTAAFRLGERVDDPLAMYLSDVFTVAPSLAGLPAISVPAGAPAAGRTGLARGWLDAPSPLLPAGLQIVGRAWDDAMVFRVAAEVERLEGEHT